MKADLTSLKLSPKYFDQVCQQVYSISGISLRTGKESLVQARLIKRLHELDLSTFEDYFDFLSHDKSGRELAAMIDVLTTNKTSFFRESQHFDFLTRKILPSLESEKKLRVWSAACSSGEEPYSISLLLHEEVQDLASWDVRILATDISTRMIERARSGTYERQVLTEVPQAMATRYFSNKGEKLFQLRDSVRSLVRFAKLNLMDTWPMSGPFDVIFCRNVMIYFDKATQQQLVGRFWNLLKPGGHLFIGHSESLSGSAHKYRYVQPAVYVK